MIDLLLALTLASVPPHPLDPEQCRALRQAWYRAAYVEGWRRANVVPDSEYYRRRC